MTEAPALTFSQEYPGGRMVLNLGAHQVGAVFPPFGSPQDKTPWAWRFWLGTPGGFASNGRAKTEQAAKNALIAEARDWLHKAGITP